MLKNMLAGISTILMVSPASRAHSIDVEDYLKYESDVEALHSDWAQVGQDLSNAATKERSVQQAKK